jgi:hypothetical protein
MALQPIDKSWSTNKKDVKYINRDFASLRQALIEFTKAYFANTNNDFSDASPGMMFIEQAAYVGDVLSYYTDAQLKESFINVASNYKNILNHAQNFGYTPKISRPATTTLTVYQTIPSKLKASDNLYTGDDKYEPDYNFCLKIKEGMVVSSVSNQSLRFITNDIVDFADESGRTISVYTQSNGHPEVYLLSKTVSAVSAEIKTLTISNFNNPFKPHPIYEIKDNSFIKILSIKDTTHDTMYYEVPYLAQEMIFIKEKTKSIGDNVIVHNTNVPYTLKLVKTNKRFTTRVVDTDTIQIRFGAASETTADEMIIPNTKNVGLGLNNSISRLEQSFDPSNFLKTSTYGIAPQDATLEIKYLSGGGLGANIPSNDLRRIASIEFDEDLLTFSNINLPTYNNSKASVAVDNLIPATGGRGIETLDEIRENAIANYSSQNRAVTKQDFEIRALSLDASFGSIAKVYVEQDSAADINPTQNILRDPLSRDEFINLTKSLVGKSEDDIKNAVDNYLQTKKTINADNNPFAINMYILSYDSNAKLVQANTLTKQNLKTYLNEYRMVTDAINILDGFIINIGVDFEITTYTNYNKREVLLNCIQAITNYFNVYNRKINQTINISEIELEIANVEGVASVPKVEIYNICGDGTSSGYSLYSYDIKEATKNKIVYPSLDPSIFELKFPNKDIKGRAL